MKSIKTSRSKINPKPNKSIYDNNPYYFQQDAISDKQSQGSIQFSVSFPSQTKRSHSPGIRGRSNQSKGGSSELRATIQNLKAQNSALASENKQLKLEIQKFKKQNQQVLQIKSIASKRLQSKNIQCQQLKFRIKQLLSKVDQLQKTNLNTSITSLKNNDDQETTLTTICLEKQKIITQEQVCPSFQKRIEEELGKYVEVKMKLDLTLRKLEQKQMLITFLQNQRQNQEEGILAL